MKNLPILTLLTALIVGSIEVPADAARVRYDWKDVPRIVAVGDVHGAYQHALAAVS